MGAYLLTRPRPEFAENLTGNEFLVTVPQPRRASEARPLLSRTPVDLHGHDRGSVCRPRESRPGALVTARQANLNPRAWQALAGAWGLSGDLSGVTAITNGEAGRQGREGARSTEEPGTRCQSPRW